MQENQIAYKKLFKQQIDDFAVEYELPLENNRQQKEIAEIDSQNHNSKCH